MSKMLLLQSIEDMLWLSNTHICTGLKPKSAVLWGNEDCPERVELYAQRNPEISDMPIAVYIADDNGNLQPESTRNPSIVTDHHKYYCVPESKVRV